MGKFIRVVGATGIIHEGVNPSGERIFAATGTGNLSIGHALEQTNTQVNSRAAFVNAPTATDLFIIDSTLPADATTASYTSVTITHSAGETSTFTKTGAATGAGTGVGDFFANADVVTIGTNPNTSDNRRGILVRYGTTGERSTAIGSLDLGGNFTTTINYTTAVGTTTAIPIAAIQAGMSYPLMEGEELTVPAGVTVGIDLFPHSETAH